LVPNFNTDASINMILVSKLRFLHPLKSIGNDKSRSINVFIFKMAARNIYNYSIDHS
jgi:hypothetical protein